MRDVLILFVHLIVTAVRLARPGGLRSVVAESVLAKHQLLILNRGRKRAPAMLPLEKVSELDTFETPVCSMVRSSKVRPFRGNSSIFCSLTSPPRLLLVVSTRGASAVTITFWDVEPTRNVILTTAS
jgi:hypothetical protein